MPLFAKVGQRPYPVARADLQKILLSGFDREVRLGAKCIGVEEDSSGITAIFADGSRACGDLLIAADGIRSILRTHVLGEEIQPQYGGYVNWNGLIPTSADLAPDRCWVVYVGDRQRASLMPVAGDRLYFFFDVPIPSGTPAHPENFRSELKSYFKGWAEPVQRTIERLDADKVSRPDIHDVGPLSRMVRGRVALLGDSAHATCPDLGQGGCQAMEDAWVLAQYLLTTNTADSEFMRYSNSNV